MPIVFSGSATLLLTILLDNSNYRDETYQTTLKEILLNENCVLVGKKATVPSAASRGSARTIFMRIAFEYEPSQAERVARTALSTWQEQLTRLFCKIGVSSSRLTLGFVDSVCCSDLGERLLQHYSTAVWVLVVSATVVVSCNSRNPTLTTTKLCNPSPIGFTSWLKVVLALLRSITGLG